MYAARQGDPNIAEFLILNMADMDSQDDGNSITFLD
jgi:hypothetical protein